MAWRGARSGALREERESKKPSGIFFPVYSLFLTLRLLISDVEEDLADLRSLNAAELSVEIKVENFSSLLFLKLDFSCLTACRRFVFASL